MRPTMSEVKISLHWLNSKLNIVFEDIDPGGSVAKDPPANAGDTETQVQSLGQKDPLEEGTAAHSSIPAVKIPQTEKSGGLQSDTTEQIQTHTHTLEDTGLAKMLIWGFQKNVMEKPELTF